MSSNDILNKARLRLIFEAISDTNGIVLLSYKVKNKVLTGGVMIHRVDENTVYIITKPKGHNSTIKPIPLSSIVSLSIDCE